MKSHQVDFVINVIQERDAWKLQEQRAIDEYNRVNKKKDMILESFNISEREWDMTQGEGHQ